ncbi:MAG: hypothetical protein AAF654_07280 [Myxococcota bacterium]
MEEERLSKQSSEFFSAGALVGQPVDDSGSMSRSSVDGLDFSTARQKRPEGMSRNDYIEARPGRHTDLFLDDSGLRGRRKTIRIMLLGLALLSIGVAAYAFLA